MIRLSEICGIGLFSGNPYPYVDLEITNNQWQIWRGCETIIFQSFGRVMFLEKCNFVQPKLKIWLKGYENDQNDEIY